MNKYCLLIIIVLTLTLMSVPAFSQLADSPWPMFQHNAQHTGRSPYVGPEFPERSWVFHAGSAIYSSPVIAVDGTIYFGTWDGYLYALSNNGNMKWKFKADGNIQAPPAVDTNGVIYFGMSSDEENPSAQASTMV
jgi:hypothetical protein